MERMNDSKRWSRLVVEKLQEDRINYYGICRVLIELETSGAIDASAYDRMNGQLWEAAKKGKLRGVIKESAADGGGFLWPKRYKTIRIEAARKLSRIVKR